MNFLKTGSRIFLLIGQFFVLIVCFAFIQAMYTNTILPDQRARTAFQQTDCFLTNKKMATSGHLIQEYRADFLISYTVNGVQYNRWVSGNGLDESFTSNIAEQDRILAQYEVGGTYPCWYDPAAPQTAILMQRHSWVQAFPILIPFAVGLITFYFLLKNIFKMLDTISLRNTNQFRDKNKKR